MWNAPSAVNGQSGRGRTEEEAEVVAEASPKRTLQSGSNSFLTFPSQGEIVYPDATYKYA